MRAETLKLLARSDALEYVEPDVSLIQDNPTQGRIIRLAQGTVTTRRGRDGFFESYPEDPDVEGLFGMTSINAPRAWTKANSSNVIVAVIDSGIDFEHEDLKANVYTNTEEIPNNGVDDDGNGYVDDFMGVDYTVLDKGKPTSDVMDRDGHGSHVAGTIGAVGNNKFGIAGVCWRVQVMPLKVFDNDGKAPNASALAGALGYAVLEKTKQNKDIRVVNMSFRWGSDIQTVEFYVGEAQKAGIMLVAAAGNLQPGDAPETVDNDRFKQYPASFTETYDNVIPVANITKDDELNARSHFGQRTVLLGAPGTEIYSTVPTSVKSEGFDSYTGTSMASPHVAGGIALIWGQEDYKDLDYKAIRKLILDNVTPLDSLKGKTVTGGKLNLAFLGDQALPTPPTPTPPPKPIPPPPSYPPPVVICPPPVYYVPCPPRSHVFYRFRCR